MIKIEVTSTNSDSIKSIIIKGHGGLDYGSDIYCAGVSSCFIGAINNLENRSNYCLSVKEGDSSLKIMDNISVHDSIVIETLITQLKTISESYPEYVQIVLRKEN